MWDNQIHHVLDKDRNLNKIKKMEIIQLYSLIHYILATGSGE